MRVIKFEQTDAVGHIVLDNPPKNLIASDFSNSLKQAVHEASESDIRALLVRAEGPNFSQGGDVLDFLEKNANQFRTFIAECNQSFRAIEALQIRCFAASRPRSGLRPLPARCNDWRNELAARALHIMPCSASRCQA